MKYQLTSESIMHFGVKLYRIEATATFGRVTTGDLGGFVAGEKNLSHDGDAWVYGNAKVYK